MEEVAAMILQTNDFSAFAKSNLGLNHFECQIHESQWVILSPEFLYHIAAKRVVRGMVRLIGGMLFELFIGENQSRHHWCSDPGKNK
ncbi:MAG: hypothetical protein IPN15_07260 [Saprospiraceae bacterium]|nr:hypothetical protein [Candidatus Vicinibacter affinis]